MSDATLIDRDGRPTLRFERRLPQPIERVWRAVTDEEEMRAWFPSGVVGDRAVGAPLAFPFDEGEAETFEGAVTEWSPPRVFAFTWNGDLLRIELSPDGDGTRLVFTQSMQHLTEAARTGAGWHQCLDHLAAALGGRAADEDTWRTKYVEYLERMGPPMAVPDAEGAVVFERTHFASPDEVRAAFDDPASWGADGAPPVEVRVAPAAFGSHFTVRVPNADPETAARWHGLLTQLDMKLASGQLVVDEAWRDRIPRYEHLRG